MFRNTLELNYFRTNLHIFPFWFTSMRFGKITVCVKQPYSNDWSRELHSNLISHFPQEGIYVASMGSFAVYEMSSLRSYSCSFSPKQIQYSCVFGIFFLLAKNFIKVYHCIKYAKAFCAFVNIWLQNSSFS